MYGIGQTIAFALLYQFIIAQSPDKMKGFVFGMFMLIPGYTPSCLGVMIGLRFTLCYDMSVCASLGVGFVVFLILSKWYTLRERNREINLQAIVEEHYERYMDRRTWY